MVCGVPPALLPASPWHEHAPARHLGATPTPDATTRRLGLASAGRPRAPSDAMANLLDALRNAPPAADLAGVRANAEVGYYWGRTGDLAADLAALYPEGHEDHEHAKDLVQAASDGAFDDDQGERAQAHALREHEAAHAAAAADDDEPDVDGGAKTEPAPTGTAAATP